MNKLDTTVAVILAAVAGCAATALALLIIAKGLGIGGGGIIYVAVLVGVGVASYKFCVKLVKTFTWIRWPILAVLVIGIAYLSINYEHFGFKDPFVPIIIVILPIALLYMFLPRTTKTQDNEAAQKRRQQHIGARGVTYRAISKPELSGQSNERLIGRYLHHMATEWWAGQSREVATCDACSGPVHKSEGYLIGSSLWCDNCYCNKDVEGQLRRNPDAAGYGVLQKARLWAETHGKEH